MVRRGGRALWAGRRARPSTWSGNDRLDIYRGKGVSAMRRLVLGAIGVAGALLLSGCGNTSVTVQSSSPAASIVVTGDSSTMTALKTKIQSQLSSSETIVDGDQHSGNHVGGFSGTKN